MLEGMIYILRTGCPWRDLPPDYGPWNSVYTRWRRWHQQGFWKRLLGALTGRAKGRLRFLDASHVKVHQDASNPAGGQQNQAMGRTKGGLNTKLTALVDVRGHALSLSLSPGQAADVKVAASALPKLQTDIVIVADKAYDSNDFRRYLRRRKARVCIPSKSNRIIPIPHHRAYYRLRHKVENFFQRIKKFRRVGTRYEKLDTNFLNFVLLATMLDWLR
jgi:transposase